MVTGAVRFRRCADRVVPDRRRANHGSGGLHRSDLGGRSPTLVLVAELGNVLEETKYLFLSNGKLTINTVLARALLK